MENLVISSGKVLIIDQFMLGNEEFWKPIHDSENTDSQLKKYGGQIESLPSGTYQVLRDPIRKMMILALEVTEPEELFENVLEKLEKVEPEKTVFIDTRCVVFCDAELLKDQDLIKEYSDLRKSGKDKPARDLLRSKGAAVRYGFNSHGDELAVAKLEEPNVVALWPDVVG